MYSDIHGVNIMTIGKLVGVILGLAVACVIAGCSSDDDPADQNNSGAVSVEDDRREIEATLEETAVRWRYGDKAVLYEQEFEYLQIEHTYDDYLELGRIRRMESDTVVTFTVKDVQFFGRDSAQLSVDVVFVGPTLDTTRLPQEWVMYFHKGRWIKPTMSSLKHQIVFEELRRQADSAAAVEEEGNW